MMWRSAVVHHLKGFASFGFTDDGAITPFLPEDRNLQVLFPNQDISANFVTPGTYAVGISNSSFWNSTIAVDFKVQDFRRFKDLPINFSKTIDAKGRETATPAERRLDFDFRNSYLISAGIAKPLSPKLELRGGYMFDYSPVPDKSVGPLFPDNTRHSATVGGTMKVGKLELSLFYQAMQMVNRTVQVPDNRLQFTNGDYRNFVHLAGAGMRFILGGDSGSSK
jgi:long-chain fatty acid transport protein